MQIKIKNWVIPATLLFALILDGLLSFHLGALTSNISISFSVNSMLIGFVLLNLVYDQNQNHYYLAFGFGLLADWYYYGFIGVNFIVLPILTLIIQYVAKAVPATFGSRLITVLLANLFLQIYIFLVFNIFGVAQISLKEFLFTGILVSTITAFVIFSLIYNVWLNLIIDYPFYRS